MHLCTAIAGQVETLQRLQTRIAACVAGIAEGKTSKTDITALQAEFIACKEVLHQLRLNIPEYLRLALGVEPGDAPHQWNYKIYLDSPEGLRWRKNKLGYIEKLNLWNTLITDNVLKNLPADVIEMDFTACKGIHTPNLRRYTKLQQINLYATTIPDAGLALLPSNVVEVYLQSGTGIMAPDLRKYVHLKKINYLNSAITDAGLSLLPTGRYA
jgi:hypothetical protein